jgi:hypothetical protein
MTGDGERELLERIARATERTSYRMGVIGLMAIILGAIAALRLILEMGRMR